MMPPAEPSTLAALTTGWSLVTLRNALRSGDEKAINAAVKPFYDTCIGAFVRFGRRLTRQSDAAWQVSCDGEDIALDAVDRAFGLLVGAGGDRVENELHFLRIVFQTARCVWVDALRAPEARHNQSHAGGFSEPGVADEPFWSGDKAAFGWLQVLFVDDERFARAMRKSRAGERRPRQYRALVLYELGEKLLGDLEGATPPGQAVVARFWRRLGTRELCVPEGDWHAVETASGRCVGQEPDAQTQLHEPIRGAVQSVSGADLQNRAKRYVLRHEMARFFAAVRGQEGEAVA